MKKFSLREIGVKNMVLLLVAGVALLLLSVPNLFQSDETNPGQAEVSAQPLPPTQAPTPVPEPDEEEKLERLLSGIRGIGQVRVMISYQSSQEKIVLKDQETTVMTAEEPQEEMPFVVKTEAAIVSGVVVLAQGAENGVIATQISDAVEALFGIAKHKIIVLPME